MKKYLYLLILIGSSFFGLTQIPEFESNINESYPFDSLLYEKFFPKNEFEIGYKYSIGHGITIREEYQVIMAENGRPLIGLLTSKKECIKSKSSNQKR